MRRVDHKHRVRCVGGMQLGAQGILASTAGAWRLHFSCPQPSNYYCVRCEPEAAAPAGRPEPAGLRLSRMEVIDWSRLLATSSDRLACAPLGTARGKRGRRRRWGGAGRRWRQSQPCQQHLPGWAQPAGWPLSGVKIGALPSQAGLSACMSAHPAPATPPPAGQPRTCVRLKLAAALDGGHHIQLLGIGGHCRNSVHLVCKEKGVEVCRVLTMTGSPGAGVGGQGPAGRQAGRQLGAPA